MNDIVACFMFFLLGMAVMGVYYFSITLRYTRPMSSLVNTIEEFSSDPTVVHPIPETLQKSKTYANAGEALDHLQRNTLKEIRQRERVADLGFAVAKINHDIRHSITTGMMVMDRVIEVDDRRIRRAATIVKHSLENAEELCNVMSEYITESHEPEPALFDIDVLLDEVAEQNNLEIAYEGPATVNLDLLMTKRMMMNLAGNAKKAEADKMTVTIWKVGALGVIDVEDNGKGIPAAAQADLFRAFRSGTGLGLGLAICRDMAVAQGGNIRVTRSEPGATEFRISLPNTMFEETSRKKLTKKSV